MAVPTHPVLEISGLAEFRALLDERASVVVDFTATWCGPCRAIGPTFHEYAHDPAYEGVVFVKVDVDAGEDIARAYQVSSMPTFVAFYKGQETLRFSGASKDKLKIMVDTAKAVLVA